jgi:predicted DNA-binding transcriptional regulator YafY
MEAMTEGRKLIIDYLKYTRSEPDTLTLHPYAVKEFAKRWYLVAHCEERKALRVYGLDRIKRIDVTEEAFKMQKGFDVDEVFATSFGPYLSEGKAELITFRTTKTEARFLRDLPLHSSQEEIRTEDKEHVTFRIFVWPNKSLIMELCKFGSGLEVLSPAEVRNAVAAQLSSALQLYGK